MRRHYFARGPGLKRRFSNRDYQLGKVFNAESKGQVMTYEERNESAQLTAYRLRNSGLNARIVNGKGWTAVYVGLQTPGKSVQTTPKTNNIAQVSTTTMKATDKPLGGRSWGPDFLGKITGVEPKQTTSESEENIYSANLLDKAFDGLLRKGIELKEIPSKLGLGELNSAVSMTKQIEGNEISSYDISDAKVIEKDELIQFINSIPSEQSKFAFARWMNSIKNTGESKQMAGREDVKKLALLMSGREQIATDKNTDGLKLFVIYTGRNEKKRPSFFQLPDQQLSVRMFSELEKMKAESKLQNEKWDNAWEKFRVNSKPFESPFSKEFKESNQ